jgi:hypothetical protein
VIIAGRQVLECSFEVDHWFPGLVVGSAPGGEKAAGLEECPGAGVVLVRPECGAHIAVFTRSDQDRVQ